MASFDIRNEETKTPANISNLASPEKLRIKNLHRGKKVPQLKLKSVRVINKGKKKNRIRSDVLYKAIIRDMRKFYLIDFNRLTDFSITKLRYD